jgi:hypothetical protein
LGTRENGKKILPHSSPLKNFKGRKVRHLECMLGPSHWLHEVSLPKRVEKNPLQRTPNLLFTF